MVKEIKVLVRIVEKGQLTGTDPSLVTKPADRPLTIGRNEDNDCQIGNAVWPFVSGQHGTLTYTKSWLTGKLWYEDKSKNGTLYLPPGVKDMSKAVMLHHQKVSIPSGAKLLVLDARTKKVGYMLEVAVA